MLYLLYCIGLCCVVYRTGCQWWKRMYRDRKPSGPRDRSVMHTCRGCLPKDDVWALHLSWPVLEHLWPLTVTLTTGSQHGALCVSSVQSICMCRNERTSHLCWWQLMFWWWQFWRCVCACVAEWVCTYICGCMYAVSERWVDKSLKIKASSSAALVWSQLFSFLTCTKMILCYDLSVHLWQIHQH